MTEGPADPPHSDPPHSGDEYSDALPEDLDVTAYVGPYTFPDIRRRRIAAYLYFAIAAGALSGWFLSGNGGLFVAAILVGLIGAYSFSAGWHLAVDQTEALAVASRTVGFPVGHASAQLAWRGLLSRPAWRMLLYSADDPPSLRGLVELDAVNGHVMGEYTERNPEDWSVYGLTTTDGAGTDER